MSGCEIGARLHVCASVNDILLKRSAILKQKITENIVAQLTQFIVTLPRIFLLISVVI